MSDSELLIVLGGAAVLILATFFSTLRRNRRTRTDYWLPDGSGLGGPRRTGPEPQISRRRYME